MKVWKKLKEKKKQFEGEIKETIKENSFGWGGGGKAMPCQGLVSIQN